MNASDKLSASAEKLGGKAKEAVGHVTGDDDKVAEGKADQAWADVKQAGQKAKDAAHDLADN